MTEAYTYIKTLCCIMFANILLTKANCMAEFKVKEQGENVTGETPRDLVLLVGTVKNYRSASLVVCRLSLLVPSANGKAKARMVRGRGGKSRVSRVLVASNWMARGQLARAPTM